MGIELRWHDDEKTILVLEYDREGSYEDMLFAFREEEHMLKEIAHRVDVILDYSLLDGMPEGIVQNIGTSINTSPLTTNPTIHFIVVVGAKRFITYFVENVVFRLYPDLRRKVGFAPNQVRALELIKEVRGPSEAS